MTIWRINRRITPSPRRNGGTTYIDTKTRKRSHQPGFHACLQPRKVGMAGFQLWWHNEATTSYHPVAGCIAPALPPDRCRVRAPSLSPAIHISSAPEEIRWIQQQDESTRNGELTKHGAINSISYGYFWWNIMAANPSVVGVEFQWWPCPNFHQFMQVWMGKRITYQWSISAWFPEGNPMGYTADKMWSDLNSSWTKRRGTWDGKPTG